MSGSTLSRLVYAWWPTTCCCRHMYDDAPTWHIKSCAMSCHFVGREQGALSDLCAPRSEGDECSQVTTKLAVDARIAVFNAVTQGHGRAASCY